jgi:hypothetical protein
VIGHETNLAWALALAAKPFMDVVERDAMFVAIGAGETFAVVRALVKWIVIKRIPVEPDLVRQCVSWLDGYAGHDSERYLRRLIDEMVSPTTNQVWATLRRRNATVPARGVANLGAAVGIRRTGASGPARSAAAATSPGPAGSPRRQSAQL